MDSNGVNLYLEPMLDDLRFAVRTLRHTAGITAAAIATLALAIGLTTAISSVFESVLLRQLPFEHPERVVSVSMQSSDPRGRVSMSLLTEWQRRAAAFESFAAYDDSQLLWRNRGQTEVLRGMRVTAGFFRTLRVNVALGRDLEPTDDPSSGDAIILTHDLWERRFGADRAVVGRTLDADGGPKRIIGVLPANFHGLRMSNPSEIPEYFAPLGRERTDPTSCAGCTVRVLGRLAPHATAEAARAQLVAVSSTAAQDRLRLAQAPVSVVPLLDRLVGPIRYALWLLLAAVLCVLLIGCANIASLQLTRATARAGEFATRMALGASRLRLASQLLAESTLLALLGGVCGIVLGWILTGVLASWAPAEMPRIDEIHIDIRVLLAACVASIATGIAFGLAPVMMAARVDINGTLKQTSRTAGRASGHRVRTALVVVDLALAFALVMTAGLLGRSLGNLQSLDAGFDPHDVLTLTPVPTATGPARTDEGRLAHYQTLMQRLSALPGVSAAGMVSNVPLSNIEPVRVFTDLDEPGADGAHADLFVIGGRYLEAMRIALMSGGPFEDGGDTPRSADAVLVSAAFAARHFHGTDPLRHRVRLDADERWRRVVGVVGDVRYRQLDKPAGDAIYAPQSAFPRHYTRLVARTAGDPRAFQRAIVASIRDVDPAEGVFHVQPMDDYVASALAARRFPVNLLALFAAVALVLTAVGLYGVLGFTVLQRMPEIAVRRALGATEAHILIWLLRQVSTMMLVGLACGAATAWAVSRLLAGWLFGVGPLDTSAAGSSVLLLLAVSLAAAAVPAMRAVRIPPMRALRAE